MIPANSGALTFRLRVHGQATHAARRTDGVSAIEQFWPVWQALGRARAAPARGRRPADGPLAAGPPDVDRASSAPATGRRRCPTCWSPRAGSASRSTSRSSDARRALEEADRRGHATPTRGCASTRSRSSGGAGSSPPGGLPADSDLVDRVRRRPRAAAGDGRAPDVYGAPVRQRPAAADRARRHRDRAVRPGRRQRWPTVRTSRCHRRGGHDRPHAGGAGPRTSAGSPEGQGPASRRAPRRTRPVAPGGRCGRRPRRRPACAVGRAAAIRSAMATNLASSAPATSSTGIVSSARRSHSGSWVPVPARRRLDASPAAVLRAAIVALRPRRRAAWRTAAAPASGRGRRRRRRARSSRPGASSAARRAARSSSSSMPGVALTSTSRSTRSGRARARCSASRPPIE